LRVGGVRLIPSRLGVTPRTHSDRLIDDIRFRQDEVIGKHNLASAPLFFTEVDQKTL
jgi:hypothetical protein